jgi:hypothetical protein
MAKRGECTTAPPVNAIFRRPTARPLCLAGLRTPLSRIQQILETVNDGLSVNAAYRTFHVSKNTLRTWQERLSPVKDALLLYAVCHQFLHQVIEGDELYPKVNSNQPPADSSGWTIVLMDRASRFI